jgi:hypothetical protein
MGLGNQGARARCVAVGMAGTAVAAALMAVLLPAAAEGWRAVHGGTVGATPFVELLVWGCGAVGVAATCWLWLVCFLVVSDAARGVTTARVGVPASVRRAVLVLCGVAIAGTLAGPAAAADSSAPDLPHTLSGLRLPERVAVAPRAAHEPDPQPPAPAAREPRIVVVEPGDTLWSITAEHLGHGATDDETSRAWPAVYALNRDLIGDDPDRITPGQRLALPAPGRDGAGR